MGVFVCIADEYLSKNLVFGTHSFGEVQYNIGAIRMGDTVTDFADVEEFNRCVIAMARICMFSTHYPGGQGRFGNKYNSAIESHGMSVQGKKQYFGWPGGAQLPSDAIRPRARFFGSITNFSTTLLSPRPTDFTEKPDHFECDQLLSADLASTGRRDNRPVIQIIVCEADATRNRP